MTWLKEFNQSIEESRKAAELAEKARMLRWEQIKKEKDTYWDPLWNKLETEQIPQLYRLWGRLQLNNLLKDIEPGFEHLGHSHLSVGGPILLVPISLGTEEEATDYQLTRIKAKPQKRGWLRLTEDETTELWGVYQHERLLNDGTATLGLEFTGFTGRTVKEAIQAFVHTDHLNTQVAKLEPPKLLGELIETTVKCARDNENVEYDESFHSPRFRILLSCEKIRICFEPQSSDHNYPITGNTEVDSAHLREGIDRQMAELFKSGSL